jgi:hypothetical protein
MRIPNPDTLVLSLSVLLGLWFLMLSLVWGRLISHHPKTYEAIGRPHFLRPHGAIATLWFLATRAHRGMEDPKLSWLSDGALAVLVLYLCGFVWLIAQTGVFR